MFKVYVHAFEHFTSIKNRNFIIYIDISLFTDLIFTDHLFICYGIAVFIVCILTSGSRHITANDIKQIHINLYSCQLNDS